MKGLKVKFDWYDGEGFQGFMSEGVVISEPYMAYVEVPYEEERIPRTCVVVYVEEYGIHEDVLVEHLESVEWGKWKI